MAGLYQRLSDDLRGYIGACGIDVLERPMDAEKPGEFDGPTITINPIHDLESACYYLAHSFGSICQWSTDFDRAQKVFEDLRKAKRGPFFEGCDLKRHPTPFRHRCLAPVRGGLIRARRLGAA
jgi:hypothetical protein